MLFLLTITPIIVQLALKHKNKLEAFYDAEEYIESTQTSRTLFELKTRSN